MGKVYFGENGQKAISAEDAGESFKYFMECHGGNVKLEDLQLSINIWSDQVEEWLAKANVGEIFDHALVDHAKVDQGDRPFGTVPVTIYGSSDDLFELDTPDRSIYEEYDCYGKTVVRLEAPNGETFDVYGVYGQGDVEWEVGVHGDSNANWPWEVSQRPDNDLDPAIIVHAPIGTTATLISEG